MMMLINIETAYFSVKSYFKRFRNTEFRPTIEEGPHFFTICQAIRYATSGVFFIKNHGSDPLSTLIDLMGRRIVGLHQLSLASQNKL